jgi:hypothetical protein
VSGRAGRKPSTPRGLAAPKAKKTISLALQGGGAHGAFTWGVLDQLIEDGPADAHRGSDDRKNVRPRAHDGEQKHRVGENDAGKVDRNLIHVRHPASADPADTKA